MCQMIKDNYKIYNIGMKFNPNKTPVQILKDESFGGRHFCCQ